MNPQRPGGNEQADLFKRIRNLLVIFVAAMVVFFIVARLTAPSENPGTIDYKTFISYLESDKIETFDAVGLDAHGTLTNGRPYTTQIPNRDTVLAREIVRHVKGTVRFESGTSNPMLYTVLTFLPFFFILVALGFILRSARRRPPS